MIAGEFKINYPNNVIPMSIEWSDNVALTLGDPINGVAFAYNNCEYFMHKVFSQEIFLNDNSPGEISVVPHEEYYSTIVFADCSSDNEVYSVMPFNIFGVNKSCKYATLLRSYNVEVKKDFVEVSWDLSEIISINNLLILKKELDDPDYYEVGTTYLTNEGSSYKLRDYNVERGKKYKYIVKEVNDYTNSVIFETEYIEIPLPSFKVFQNHPNPFNPVTTITFELPERQRVCLEIFNSKGEKVIKLLDLELDSGLHSIDWNGRDQRGKLLHSGVYFYRIKTRKYVETKKMVLIR